MLFTSGSAGRGETCLSHKERRKDFEGSFLITVTKDRGREAIYKHGK